MLQHFCGLFSSSITAGSYAYEAYEKQPAVKKSVVGLRSSTSEAGNYLFENLNTQCKPREVAKATQSNLRKMLNQEDVCIRKVKKSNYSSLLQEHHRIVCKWTDQDFPPNHTSIGQLHSMVKVFWKRVSEVYPNVSIIKEGLLPTHIDTGESEDCYLTRAFRSLATHQTNIRRLFPDPSINPYGIYMIRILYCGILQQVTIDDFIPCNQLGQPLFAQSTTRYEIWPILLEKCWAKIKKSYVSIFCTLFIKPEGTESEILRVFSYAPVQQFSFGLENHWQRISQAHRSRHIVQLVSKNEAAFQMKGLEPRKSYEITDIAQRPEKIVKLRNCQQIPLKWSECQSLFQTLSICYLEDNFNHLSEQMSLSGKRGKYGLYISTNQAALTSFTLSYMASVNGIPRIVRTTLVIARYQKANIGYQYKYVASRTCRGEADNSIILYELPQGQYVIFCRIDWPEQKQDKAVLSVQSTSKGILRTVDLSSTDRFLYKTLLDHARRNPNKQILCQQPYEWICSEFLLAEGGYGYIVVHLDEESTRRLGIELSEKEYNERRLILKKPYKGQGKIKMIVEPGRELIIVFRMKALNYPNELTLPTPRLYNLI